MSRPNTFARGATDAVQQILAHLDIMPALPLPPELRTGKGDYISRPALKEWIGKRVERANKVGKKGVGK